MVWLRSLGERIRPTRHPWRAWAAFLVFVGASSLFSAAGFCQAGVTSEYRSEAKALSNIPSFIEWPPDTFASSEEAFRVCVYGNFPFGTVLSEVTRAGTAQGRRVEVLWVRKEGQLRQCQVLFISHSERKNYAKILAAVRGASVLTVGETSDFNECGGILEFAYEEEALRFDVNLAAASEAHLKISSRFLSLARRVLRTTEAARG